MVQNNLLEFTNKAIKLEEIYTHFHLPYLYKLISNSKLPKEVILNSREIIEKILAQNNQHQKTLLKFTTKFQEETINDH